MEESISENVRKIISSIPSNVTLEAAAKTRGPGEVRAAVEAGVGIIGENYLQEAEEIIHKLGSIARWHYIGHLQSRKIKRIVSLFDLIETVSSMRHAELIDRYSGELEKKMPILVEVNSGREEQKGGVHPDEAIDLVKDISTLGGVRVDGLMTMGVFTSDDAVLGKCFGETKRLYDSLCKVELPNVRMRYLSMGMSSSYRKAIEEGANLIRVGEAIFGPRP